jgi:carbohydrate-selective porin OprB
LPDARWAGDQFKENPWSKEEKKSNASSFGRGLDDQYTVEIFHRIPVTQQIAITPNVQYLKDPH